jgi:hypothetical protein
MAFRVNAINSVLSLYFIDISDVLSVYAYCQKGKDCQ